MKRRDLLAGIAASGFARLVRAQPRAEPRKIGVMLWGGGLQRGHLRDGLRELGYHEGRNLIIEWRMAAQSEPAERHAAELVKLDVELIVVYATPNAHAAQKTTQAIPIVLAGIADPVGSGLVKSLSRPEGNVTGVSRNLPGLAAKRLELLKEALPQVSRVGFLGSNQDPATRRFVENTQTAAERLGIRLQVVLVNDPADLAAAFDAMHREQAQAVIVQPLFVSHAQMVSDLAAARRLPLIADFNEFAEAGGLLAYGPALALASTVAARYVDKILRGAKPSDLPIEEPREFELIINLRTARKLGLTVPPALLLRASRVIQ